MRYEVSIIFFLLTGVSCSSRTRSMAKYGPDGKLVSKVVAKGDDCAKPTERYTKGIEAGVKRAFDSLKMGPFVNFTLDVKNTIVRLADYSTEGLDFAYLQYNLCVLANSVGLYSDSAKTAFMMESLRVWESIQKSKSKAVIDNRSGNFSENQQGGD